MGKHFDYDYIQTDDLADLFETAERKRYGFFRIILTPDQMVYYDKYTNKFPLACGIVIHMDAKGTMRKILFDSSNSSMYFQAVGILDDCFAYSLHTESCHLEKELLLGGSERFIVILKTVTSVIFLTYDGGYEKIGCTFCMEYNDQPSVVNLLQMALELPKR